MMTVDKIRATFISFFRKKRHTAVASDSLIPQHDPTLLFTGAGMNQFKDQFMGRNLMFTRAATCQKCLRTGDLDNVGRTAGHHTFFEMLGNFSFGDYFKKDAIEWAWEFLTRQMRLPEDKLWVSVYKDDEEAYDIWVNFIKIPKERLIRLGDKENFWPSEAKKNGPNGPCGPCSEIFYDWGPGTGCCKKECDPSCDCGRFVEIWNLVFTQFNRKDGGALEPLPKKNIDTGMGLERLAAVMQNKRTNFGIDTFAYIIKVIARELEADYGRDKETDSHMNAIADHVRAVTFAIFDGVRPSNEGRGFVVRKLIRKASQRARALGIREPFMHSAVPAVVKVMKGAYPEMAKRSLDIEDVVLTEEVNLKEVLDTVLPRLEEEIGWLKEKGEKDIPGSTIFKYYDEKGIPLDVIEESAGQCGMTLDMEGFDRLLKAQKERSRSKSKVAGSIFVEKLSDVNLKTKFLYDEVKAQAKVLAILKEFGGQTKRVNSARSGDEVHIALDTTPFYGEAGGQAGDCGVLVKGGLKIVVHDTRKYEDTIDHMGEITTGKVNVGDLVEARIDVQRRERIMRNHTATHLLHSVLKKVLGQHVRQYGSLVEADRLRFDFTHTKKVGAGEIEFIEEEINAIIERDIPVTTVKMGLEEARSSGAVALFGEKYKESVMVRTIGDISKELCGGTHVDKTGRIRAFKILSESSIASGARRIEALTGDAVHGWISQDIEKTVSEYKDLVESVKNSMGDNSTAMEKMNDYLAPVLFNSEAIVKKGPDEFNRKDVNKWIKELKPKFARMIEDLSRESKKIKKASAADKLNVLMNEIDTFIKESKKAGRSYIVSRRVEGADGKALRSLMDAIKKKAGSAVILLGSSDSSKASLVCGVTEDLVKCGLDASDIIKKIAVLIGGSGGGRADMAQAGGKKPARLEEALEKGVSIIEKGLK